MMVDVNLGDACYGHRAGPVGCVQVARKVVNRMMASQQQLATLNPHFRTAKHHVRTPCLTVKSRPILVGSYSPYISLT